MLYTVYMCRQYMQSAQYGKVTAKYRQCNTNSEHGIVRTVEKQYIVRCWMVTTSTTPLYTCNGLTLQLWCSSCGAWTLFLYNEFWVLGALGRSIKNTLQYGDQNSKLGQVLIAQLFPSRAFVCFFKKKLKTRHSELGSVLNLDLVRWHFAKKRSTTMCACISRIQQPLDSE